ncbi:MAG: hypothetical protein NW208_18465 [Bryobacter sp.]|nr:hypothetical protein [Bryobacter sp.]
MKNESMIFGLIFACSFASASDSSLVLVKKSSIVGQAVAAKSYFRVAKAPLGLISATRISDTSLRVSYPADSTQNQRHYTIPLNSPFGAGTQHFCWTERSQTGTTFAVHELTTNTTRRIESPIQAVNQLQMIGTNVYLISEKDRIQTLSRLNLEISNIENLNTLEAHHSIVRFGSPHHKHLVIVDPISGQFRIDSIDPNYKVGNWRTISREGRTPEASSSYETAQGVKALRGNVLAHAIGSTPNTHIFVVPGEKNVASSFALQVDGSGNQLKQWNLKPDPDMLQNMLVEFRTVTMEAEGLTFFGRDGNAYTFQGVQ